MFNLFYFIFLFYFLIFLLKIGKNPNKINVSVSSYSLIFKYGIPKKKYVNFVKCLLFSDKGNLFSLKNSTINFCELNLSACFFADGSFFTIEFLFTR